MDEGLLNCGTKWEGLELFCVANQFYGPPSSTVSVDGSQWLIQSDQGNRLVTGSN
jgi:hypothetical protein